MTLSADILLAEYEDIIERTVLHLLETHRDQLPDLSTVCVITPSRNLSAQFRKTILRCLPEAQRAVIPPYIGTLQQWVSENIPLNDASVDLLSEQARLLLFVEALSAHPALFREENKWQVSTAILALFDELALNTANLLERSSYDWVDMLQQAYGCEESSLHLQQEARLVYVLWQAWQQQMRDERLLDATEAYIARLERLGTLPNRNRHFYLIDPDQLAACEQHALAALAEQHRCTVVAYDSSAEALTATPMATAAAFIHTALAHETAPLINRAAAFKQHTPDVRLPFSMFYAGDAETEARAVDLQVRMWLLQGKQTIGIVSEDRKLSRRVRALLERANVHLQDMAGWSLSTTSAAAVLERWLECIEQDFDYRPMLDLFKSHFFRSALGHDKQLECVYRLENDIILHENISHGLKRYRKQLGFRLRRLENWPQNTYDDIVQLLDQVEKAALHLQQLYHSNRLSSLDVYLSHLINSLEQLGIMSSFSDDAAGLQIRQALDEMRHGLKH